MNVFDAWLIVVGLAIGAGLAWLVMLDLRRRDDDIAAAESRAEAAWIADTLRSRDVAADAEAVEEVLRLHRAYLAGIPDDGAPRAARSAPFDTEYEDDDGAAEDADEAATAVLATRPLAPPSAVAPVGAAASPSAVHDALASGAAEGDAFEPAWPDKDLEAAHEALEALLHKAPPED